ncbi:2-C-methyl-D-erythritol 4-phosphate cytidylyltransferase [Desulfoferula mesophila]|uniref:Bifunctional enzyme IspD/IspF n=1 Tax=Desulfoferula mesophila TaxID=3058419 RepID=A0AAU9EZH6_9BACT|nr:bifunctional enzyme IspD/IspF [Desulfoferula mesophilus]
MQGMVVAVVPAAGAGTRLGGERPKQFLPLAGRPLLTRTLMVLEATPQVQAVVVVCPPGAEDETWRACVEPYGLAKVAAVVPGGAQRQDSVAAGVARAARLGAEWLVVHDAARPLARPELFARVLAAAAQTGAAIAAVPAADTIKQAGEGDLAQSTLDRSQLWLVQTPQVFRRDLLERALAQATADGFYATDEAGLVERMGEKVKLVMGSRDNLKITTPEDLALAQGIMGPAMRVGQGFDAHRLAPGRRLVLAGVDIPHETGLLGHSDADVAVHALMDALLAAAGLGDIGQMFPDSDPAYKDADSMELLARVLERLAAQGWRPAQVSLTILAQRPKIAPHYPAMRAKLAQAMDLETGEVNLAASTTEGLGFVGREEGLAAWATVVIAPR